MVLPVPLLERFKQQLGFYACTVSNFEQYTLAHFIEDGFLDKHINRMQSSIKDRINIYEENSGLHFLLKYDTELTDEQLKQKASKKGLLISFLSDYITGNSYSPDNYSHIAIVNYSGISMDDVAITAKLLEEICL